MKRLKDILDDKNILLKLKKEKKLSYEYLSRLFLSLHTYLKSGVSLVDAVDLLGSNEQYEKILTKISASIKKGDSLSNAMKDAGNFPEIAIFLIKTGEQSGNLSTCFERLSIYYDELSKIKNHIKSVSVYPLILVVSVIFLLIYINFYFIPSMGEIFAQDDIRLNSFSRLIILISSMLSRYPLESILVIISIIMIIFGGMQSFISQKNKTYLKSNIPIIGRLSLNNIWLNIFFSYSLMLESGVDIVTSSRLISSYVENDYVKEKLVYFTDNLTSGNSISSTLKNLKIRDMNIIYFLTLGEETGQIRENIDILKEMYIDKSQKDYKTLISMVQPALIFFITIILGITMFAVLIPMLDYSASL